MGIRSENLTQDNPECNTQLNQGEEIEQASGFFFAGQIIEAKKILVRVLNRPGQSMQEKIEKLRAISLLIRIHTEGCKYNRAAELSQRGHALEKELLNSTKVADYKLKCALSAFYYERSIFDFSRAQYGNALNFARSSEKMAPKDQTAQIIRAKYSRATILANTGELDTAEAVLDELDQSRSDKLPLLDSFIYILRGEIHRFRGDLNSANPFFEKALRLQKTNKNGKLYHSILLCLAKTSKDFEQFDKARTYLSLADADIDADAFLRFNRMVLLEKIDFEMEMSQFENAASLFGEFDKDNAITAEDVFLQMTYCRLKLKYAMLTKNEDEVPKYLELLHSLARKSQNPAQVHMANLKEAEFLIQHKEIEKAFYIAKACLDFFEEKGLIKQQVGALGVMIQCHIERKSFVEVRNLIQRRMALEIRFAYYRSYVRSSLLMTVAMKKGGDSSVSESILLNALKVAHRVNLPAERAAIYRMLGEEENFEREFQCLDSKKKAEVEYFINDFEIKDFLEYDLVIDQNTNTVIHSQLGTITFGNKFTLMKILVALSENHGQSVSKEVLAEKLWKRPYNPMGDDNTIYIHMNRLRKVLEREPSKPTIVLNTHNGYQVNSALNIKMIPFVGKLERDRFPKMEILLKTELKVTSRKVQNYFKVSKATAARDLSRWVEEGKLVRHHVNGQYFYTLPDKEDVAAPTIH